MNVDLTYQTEDLKEEIEQLKVELAKVTADKNEAYAERNKVVALLARHYPSGTRETAIEGWDPEWHGCVWLDTPKGQMSWHYHASDAYLFEELPRYDTPWDEHSTRTKYTRLIGELVRLDWERAAGKPIPNG